MSSVLTTFTTVSLGMHISIGAYSERYRDVLAGDCGPIAVRAESDVSGRETTSDKNLIEFIRIHSVEADCAIFRAGDEFVILLPGKES